MRNLSLALNVAALTAVAAAPLGAQAPGAPRAGASGGHPLTGAVVIQVIRAAELGASILPLVSGAAAEGATAWIVVTDLPEPVFATLLAPGAEPAVRALPGFAATVVVRRSVVADSSGNP